MLHPAQPGNLQLLGSSMVSLKEEDMPLVDQMTEEGDVMGLIDFMEAHYIPYEGLNSTEEYRERIGLEFSRQRRESPKDCIGQAICESGDTDGKKRERLTGMFKHLQEIVTIKDETKKQEMVAHFLETEGTTADIEEDCKERIADLQGQECVILVAGETSAGKSSVLNLLLGEVDEVQLLPVHTKSCTATITTIRYGKQRRARILYRSKEPYEISTLDEEGIKKFHDIVFMSEERESHDIKEAQVYLPLCFLKSGLVLADTPGIGENDFLESYLMEYIEQNQILGFMYIIMSDHVGGVQEDRLLLLLKMIIEQQKKSKSCLKFDPKAALFVCNRFYAIPEKDRQDVKERILDKLGKCWPDFDKSNALYMSTKNAIRDVQAHPDYINDEFKALLDGLKKLYGTAMDRRIRSSYKWMENVLKRIMHFLKSVVIRLDMSERDRLSRLKKSKEKLDKLLSQSGQVIASLHVELQESIENVCVEVRKYLRKPSVQLRLTALWGPKEIPDLDDTPEITSAKKWLWLKERIDAAFYDRLCGILEEWDNDECKLNEIEDKVIEDIKMKLGILEHEIRDVEHDMSSSGSSEDLTRSRRGRRVSLTQSRVSIQTDDVKLPMKVNARLFTNSKPSKFLGHSKVKSFNKDPHKMAKSRAQKLLDKLVNDKSNSDDFLKSLVSQLFQRPLECLHQLEERIPSIIKANEDMLNEIEVANATERKHLSKYVSMVEEIDTLRKYLMDYGEGYIFVHDFKSDEVKILQETSTGSMSITVRDVTTIIDHSKNSNDVGAGSNLRGLWTILSPGVVVRGNGDESVTIRVYLQSSAVENTFQEVAKLRCLVHSDVCLAEFLGIHHVDAATPAFIYSGRLQSVSYFMRTCSEPSSHFGRILTQTATALQYIHSKGLVHMELTKNTLTVNERGEVCATGACLPRKATLPYDTNMSVAEFVYLAPEVLNGELYVATADVYSYGILLLELVLQHSIFRSERKNLTFQEFHQKICTAGPEAMLLKGVIPMTLTDEALIVVKKCLSSDKVSLDLVAEVKEIKDFKRKSFGTPGRVFTASLREKQM